MDLDPSGFEAASTIPDGSTDWGATIRSAWNEMRAMFEVAPRGSAVRGIQYVRPDGSDQASGTSWHTAKQTIQAAHDALESESGAGRIHLSPGIHRCNDISITKPGTAIPGSGLRATQLSVTYPRAIGLTIEADLCIVRDLEVRDQVANGHAGGGIYIHNGQDVVVDAVAFDEIGAGADAGEGFDERPFAMKIQGDDDFSDWIKLSDLRFRNNYSAILIGGGCNGFSNNIDCLGNPGAEHIFVLRRDNGAGNDVSWRGSNVWLAGGPPGRYMITIDSIDENTDTYQMFNNLHLELSGAAMGVDFIYCNASRNQFNNILFNGGGDGDREAVAIQFGEGARPSTNIVGAHPGRSRQRPGDLPRHTPGGVGVWEMKAPCGPPPHRSLLAVAGRAGATASSARALIKFRKVSI